MPPPTRSARGERTREALRQAAQVRFLAEGVEATSAEQIAADAGVTLRTFYRHFGSKHELLFGEYDASLKWFRSALDSRPDDESLTDSVLAAIHSFPFASDNMLQIAALRDDVMDREQVEGHIRQVQAEFAVEVECHLVLRGAPSSDDERFLLSVTARCMAAATFAALDTWMRGAHDDLEELTRLTELALHQLEHGLHPLTIGPKA